MRIGQWQRDVGAALAEENVPNPFESPFAFDATARIGGERAAAKPVVKISLLGLSYPCWRCGEVSSPIVAMTPTGANDLSDDLSGELVICDGEFLLAFAWKHLPAGDRRRWRVGEVRNRPSKTAGCSYLSNGCAYCGALFGAIPLLHEELPEALAIGGLSALVQLTIVDVPTATWSDILESRWT
jgi:hypothetical protein